jgi:hypothetical protein
MMEWNAQYEAAKRMAEILKMHHEFRSVKHDGTVVYYEWKKQLIRISFNNDERKP